MPIHTASTFCQIAAIHLVLWVICETSALAQKNTDEQPIYKYVGNLFSLKFHRPSCKFARAMWRGNIIRFQFRKQAVDHGQKPCRYCLPPDWKSVGAKLLGIDSASATPDPKPLEETQISEEAHNNTEINEIQEFEKGKTDAGDSRDEKPLPFSGTADQKLPKEPAWQQETNRHVHARTTVPGSTSATGEVKQADNNRVSSD